MRTLVLAVLLLPAVALADEKRDDAAAEMAKGDEAYFNQHDAQSAIAHYNAARLLAPDRPGPYLALGQAYQATGHCKQATAMMQNRSPPSPVRPNPVHRGDDRGCLRTGQVEPGGGRGGGGRVRTVQPWITSFSSPM